MSLATIALVHPHRALLPETDLYARYFRSKGWEVQILTHATCRELGAYEVRWHLMGLDCCAPSKHQTLIHEYISPSVPPFSSVKDLIKRINGPTPHGRVFAHPAVAAHLRFADNRPVYFRPPGVAAAFFSPPAKPSKSFDFVYCGSMAPVRRLHDSLRQVLTSFPGCRLLLVGEPDPAIRRAFRNDLTFSGRVPPSEVPALLSTAEYGLNLIPNRAPFRSLPSLKLLEYCARGLRIISSDIPWARAFEKDRNARFFFLPAQPARCTWRELLDFPFQTPDVTDLHWENILETKQLNQWLLNLHLA